MKKAIVVTITGEELATIVCEHVEKLLEKDGISWSFDGSITMEYNGHDVDFDTARIELVVDDKNDDNDDGNDDGDVGIIPSDDNSVMSAEELENQFTITRPRS